MGETRGARDQLGIAQRPRPGLRRPCERDRNRIGRLAGSIRDGAVERTEPAEIVVGPAPFTEQAPTGLIVLEDQRGHRNLRLFDHTAHEVGIVTGNAAGSLGGIEVGIVLEAEVIGAVDLTQPDDEIELRGNRIHRHCRQLEAGHGA